MNDNDDSSNLPTVRQRGVGASDAAVILGLSPYRTRFDLFLDKIGRGTPIVDNLAMQCGRALEPVVLDLCSETIGHQIIDRGTRVRDPALPWRWVTLDGRTDNAIVEAKTANSSADWGEVMTDQIPVQYVVQTQHALDITRAEICWVPVLFAAREFRLYKVVRDPIIGAAILEAEKEFWGHVERNEPPPLQSPAELRIRWPQDSGTDVVASPEIEAHAYALGAVKSEIDKLKAEAATFEAAIQTHMEDASQLVDSNGEVLVTWKTARAPVVFDEATFKHAHPELWRQFQMTGKASRRFLVKT
jgi:putative phage-type endonuclease